MRITEWAVMELEAKNHGNTLPKNWRVPGAVKVVASREAAEEIVATRARFHRPAAAVVSRVVTVGPWEHVESHATADHASVLT